MNKTIVLNPGDPPLWIARIPEFIALPVVDACRDVHLTADVYRHILERRLRDGDPQAAVVLARMFEVVALPTHCGCLTRDTRRIELYRSFPNDLVGVCVSVKCLGAEAWINTAFPIGTRTFEKYIRQGRIRPVMVTMTVTAESTVANDKCLDKC